MTQAHGVGGVRNRLSLRLRWSRIAICLLIPVVFWSGPSRAEKVILFDGRVLEGRFANLTGVAVDPLNAASTTSSSHILMCDNELTRAMVSKRKVDKIEPAPPARMEHFKIPQQVVENGSQVAALGPIVNEGKFDRFGRRIFSFMTKGGAVNVIQGLTEITPQWSKVETLKGGGNYIWDMRIATSSIPRDALSTILLAQIDPKNPDDRLKLVRFYMQAERFTDAESELRQAIEAFKAMPNMQGLDTLAKSLRQLSAERLLAEVDVRLKAGQNNLAYTMLQNFPVDSVPGVVLQAVRDKTDNLMKLQKRGTDTVDQIDNLLKDVKNAELKRALVPLCKEIHEELNFATLDRLATFRRLADDNTLLAEQRLALAISGWLLGSDDAIDNVQVAASLAETRNRIREYLNEPLPVNRRRILSLLVSEQGAAPKYAAGLLSHMKPPIDTPVQEEQPGMYRLEIRGLDNEPDVSYLVQLPPEYDPYKKYPTIVTLHSAGTTPELQIDWWAGVSPDEKAAAEKTPAKPDPIKPNPAKPVDPKNKNAKPAVADAAVAKADEAKADPAKLNDEKPDDAKPKENAVVNRRMRLGQASRYGYIVIAPAWTKPHQGQYEYSAREHAAVLGALRDASKRFSIDTDRVYLSGHSIGGDAAWDIALAHPDLWAGVIPIGAIAAKYVNLYWPNAEKLPLYFITGELDGGKTVLNASQWDRYLGQPKGWDTTVIEYQGRGHENFSDEILRLFDWMGRKQRDFFPKQMNAVTMRSWDNYFWCIELSQMPNSKMIEPTGWPLPHGTQPLRLEAHVTATNGIIVDMHAAKVTVWLSPEWVDFARPISVTINGQRTPPKPSIKPELSVMLEDVRTRGDRQHPFWAKVEQP